MEKQKNIWWDKSITLVEGCSPVSAGCDHCWSAGMAHRFKGALTTDKGKFNGNICCDQSRLDRILKRKKPTRWTIWNDLFHESVPFEFIDRVYDTMLNCHWHTFQILTKRPERMLKYYREHTNCVKESDNIWLGTTTENQEMADKRIPILLQIPAAVRFVSVEPMLSAVRFKKIPQSGQEIIDGWEKEGLNPLEIETRAKQCVKDNYIPPEWSTSLDWIICGGESGPGARPMHPKWPWDLLNQCKAAGVPFFMKQIHEYPGDGKIKLVKDINDFPEDLRIREYPNGK